MFLICDKLYSFVHIKFLEAGMCRSAFPRKFWNNLEKFRLILAALRTSTQHSTSEYKTSHIITRFLVGALRNPNERTHRCEPCVLIMVFVFLCVYRRPLTSTYSFVLLLFCIVDNVLKLMAARMRPSDYDYEVIRQLL